MVDIGGRFSQYVMRQCDSGAASRTQTSSSTSRTASRSSRRCGNGARRMPGAPRPHRAVGPRLPQADRSVWFHARARVMPPAYRHARIRRDLSVHCRRARAHRRRSGWTSTRSGTWTEPVSEVVPEDPERMYLALSRLVPHKRIDVLLDIWEQVLPRWGDPGHRGRRPGASTPRAASRRRCVLHRLRRRERETAAPRSGLAPAPPGAARGLGRRRDGSRGRRHADDRLRRRRCARFGAARHHGSARRDGDPIPRSAGSISRRIRSSGHGSARVSGHGRTTSSGIMRSTSSSTCSTRASVTPATGRPRGS